MHPGGAGSSPVPAFFLVMAANPRPTCGKLPLEADSNSNLGTEYSKSPPHRSLALRLSSCHAKCGDLWDDGCQHFLTRANVLKIAFP